MEYWVGRVCMICGHEDQIELTKEQSAFDLYDGNAIEQTACSKCGATQISSLHHQLVKVDKALLDRWGQDATLFFLAQD